MSYKFCLALGFVNTDVTVAMCVAPLYNVKRLSPAAISQHISYHTILGVAHTWLYTVDRPAALIARLGEQPATALYMPWVWKLTVHSRAQNFMNNDCVHRAGAHGFGWALSIDLDEFIFLGARTPTLSLLLASPSHSSGRRNEVDNTTSQVLTLGSRISPPLTDSFLGELNATVTRRAPVWCETRPATLVAQYEALKFRASRSEFLERRADFFRRDSNGVWEGSLCSSSTSAADVRKERKGTEQSIDPAWWKHIPDLQTDIDQHAMLSKLGVLHVWWSPEGEWLHKAATRHRVRAERREYNRACIDETIARRAESEPELCPDWRGRRKWLLDTHAAWVANIHWAVSCKSGECSQRHLHAAHHAFLLHLSPPRESVWMAMPGGGRSWDRVRSPPPSPLGGGSRALEKAPPPSSPRDNGATATSEIEGVLKCTNASHVWITVGRNDGAAALAGATSPFCHEHLVLPVEWMMQFARRRRSFWRNRWLLVHEYLHAHSTPRLAILSDAYVSEQATNTHLL